MMDFGDKNINILILLSKYKPLDWMVPCKPAGSNGSYDSTLA